MGAEEEEEEDYDDEEERQGGKRGGWNGRQMGADDTGSSWELRVALRHPKLRGSRGVIAASDINPWLHGSKHGHQIDYQSRRDQSSMGSTKRQSAGGTTCREPEEQTMGCDLFASLQGSGKARSMLEKKKGINGNITIENTYICPNAGVS